MENSFIFAFLLTFLAGLSTAVGGILAFFIKKENITALALGLGFSAGVMIYVSLVELLKNAQDELFMALSSDLAKWITIFAFFGGIILSAIIDRMFPDHLELKYFAPKEEKTLELLKKQKLHRMGLFTAAALAVHNFPEGLATFMAGMTNHTLGISIAIAIAIHNIPEGVSIALPIYHATGNKAKAFWFSFIAGLAEPLGAILGFAVFGFLFSKLSFGILFAAVAGVMIYVSFDELLPMAHEYGNGHIEIFGVIIGMFVMAVSLILF